MEFTEFSLSRAVEESRRPAGDATQEEVWLADGDQLFGDALHIDRRAVEIQGAFGKRSLPWAEVRGCWFRRDAALRALMQPGSPGARVRLWIDSGLDPEPDVLDGVLKAIDDKQATLQHPVARRAAHPARTAAAAAAAPKLNRCRGGPGRLP